LYPPRKGTVIISDQKKFGLTAAEVESYADDGYVLAKEVFTATEAEHFRREGQEVIERLLQHEVPEVRMEGWKSGAKVTDLPRELLHCHNVQFHSAAFARLISDPRLTDRVADLIGANVQLHHTKLFIKPPETGAPFPMHQDVHYFPHERDTMMAAIIHFDDAPLERGCVRVIPGSHKRGRLKHLNDGGRHLPVDEYPVADATPCPARAGDVLFFSYLTVHGSALNTSDQARTTLLVQMRDPTDPPTQMVHRSRGQGMMLRGVDPTADAGPGTDSPSRRTQAAAEADANAER
jgi:phytanoyl-CoA hydroxylase